MPYYHTYPLCGTSIATGEHEIAAECKRVMDKQSAIAKIMDALSTASAAECEIALTFIRHMTQKEKPPRRYSTTPSCAQINRESLEPTR